MLTDQEIMSAAAGWRKYDAPEGCIGVARVVYGACRAVIAAAQAKHEGAKSGPAVPEWQPIETAPKDGPVLVCCRHGMYVAEWRDIDVAYWHVDDNKHGPFPLRGTAPTHWMPIPAAPSAEGERDD